VRASFYCDGSLAFVFRVASFVLRILFIALISTQHSCVQYSWIKFEERKKLKTRQNLRKVRSKDGRTSSQGRPFTSSSRCVDTL
jgi:hypothetical protein